MRVEVIQVALSDWGGRRRRQAWKLVVDIPVNATVRAVKRCILEKRALPLLTNVVLTHAGQQLEELQAQQHGQLDWQAFSILHAAVMLSMDNKLTLDNLHTHPAVAEEVICAGGGRDDDGVARAALRVGSVLWINDHEADAPLGNGAFGVAFNGKTRLGHRFQVSQSVARSDDGSSERASEVACQPTTKSTAQ